MYDLLNSVAAPQLHFPICNIFNALFPKNPTNLRYHFCTAIAVNKEKEIIFSAEEITVQLITGRQVLYELLTTIL